MNVMKSVVLFFRATPSLARAVAQAARKAGMRKSEWLRAVVTAALERP